VLLQGAQHGVYGLGLYELPGLVSFHLIKEPHARRAGQIDYHVDTMIAARMREDDSSTQRFTPLIPGASDDLFPIAPRNLVRSRGVLSYLGDDLEPGKCD
jgi:hypothetical protein